RRGLIVSIPLPARRGWARGEERVEAFIRERESWIVRHLAHLDRQRAATAAHGAPADGGAALYRGELHRIRVEPASPGVRRSTVERAGAEDGDELVVSVASRD